MPAYFSGRFSCLVSLLRIFQTNRMQTKERGMHVMNNDILRFPGVKQVTGLSRSTIWLLEKKGLFPTRRQLSPGSVGWLRQEIDVWVKTRTAVEEQPKEATTMKPIINFSQLNALALPHLPTILQRWLPEGKQTGNEYISRNPTRHDQHAGSFKINIHNLFFLIFILPKK